MITPLSHLNYLSNLNVLDCLNFLSIIFKAGF